MIHYTLQGPIHSLEIHEDKLRLRKKIISQIFGGPSAVDWDIHGLASFEITIPQYVLWGKIEWTTFDGKAGAMRFSTHPAMVQKIERYMQKVISRNQEKVKILTPRTAKIAPTEIKAAA